MFHIYTTARINAVEPIYLVMILRNDSEAFVGLLRELCGFDQNITNNNQMKIAKIVQLIYGCRNSKLVLPLSFQENLLVILFPQISSCLHITQR